MKHDQGARELIFLSLLSSCYPQKPISDSLTSLDFYSLTSLYEQH